MPADLLTAVGRALFGDRWKADMAHALNERAVLAGKTQRVSVDRVDDWSKGRSNVPAAIWLEIAGLIQDRERDLPALKAQVLQAANPERPPHTDGRQTDTRQSPRSSNSGGEDFRS